MLGGSWPARCWRRLSQLDGRLARRMKVANLTLSLLPLVLFEAHASTAVVVAAVAVWTASYALTLPDLVGSMVVCWRAGTRAKWRARILRAHAAELRELRAELRELSASLDGREEDR